jgi:hypothetical protein
MSVFTQLDARLAQFAADQQAVLTRNREDHWPLAPELLGFEERRVDWERAGLKLAVIIQPDFLATGVDTTKWNFRAVAWQYRAGDRYYAIKDLVTSRPFQHIEEQVEILLAEARSYLGSIRPDDLRNPYMDNNA